MEPSLRPLDRNLVYSKLTSEEEAQDISQTLLIKNGQFENKMKRKRKAKLAAIEMKFKEFSEIMAHADTSNQRVMRIVNSKFEEMRVDILQETSAVKKEDFKCSIRKR